MSNEIKKDAKRLGNDEMKKIRGGLEVENSPCRSGTCWYYESGTGNVGGYCEENSKGKCVCNAGTSSIVTSDCSGNAI